MGCSLRPCHPEGGSSPEPGGIRFGVPHYWIVDPDDRGLEAFEARDGAWVRLGAWIDGDTPPVPPFDAIELDVGGPLSAAALKGRRTSPRSQFFFSMSRKPCRVESFRAEVE